MADARGKLGGIVGSRNGAGAYVRTFVSPVNPDTALQQSKRALMGALSASWRGLTDAERESWGVAAPQFPSTDSLGNVVIYSGQQLFMKLNMNLLAAGQTAIDRAPAPISQPALVFTSLVISTLAGVLDAFTINRDVLTPPGHTLQLTASPSVSAGINAPKKGLFREIAIENDWTSTSYDAIADYQAKYGNPAVGDTIHASIVLIDQTSGQRGVRLTSKTVVTGT